MFAYELSRKKSSPKNLFFGDTGYMDGEVSVLTVRAESPSPLLSYSVHARVGAAHIFCVGTWENLRPGSTGSGLQIFPSTQRTAAAGSASRNRQVMF